MEVQPRAKLGKLNKSENNHRNTKQQEKQLKELAGNDPSQFLLFDSDFESGNLDMAV